MFEDVYFELPKVASVLFIFMGCEALCRLRHQGFYFPHLAAFASVTLKPSYWLWLLKWASIILLIVALMSPVKETLYRPVGAPGHAMVLVIDASGSMRDGGFDQTDRTKSRFETVQVIVNDFIARRAGDTIGLIVFGTHSFVASPPTNDMRMLSAIVDRLYVGIAGPYTALYEAIAKGAALLHGNPSREKIIVLLTDGRNSPGAPVGPNVAQALAEKEGVRLYAVVIGNTPKPQESELQVMAEATGGRYFEASDASALAEIYAQIDSLETSPQRPPAITVKTYYYIFPLFLGFLTLLLYVYWRNRRVS